MIYAFRGHELDEELFQLRRRGRVVKVEPKAFDLLAYLLCHRDRVVPKRELLDSVWPSVRVAESVLPSCVGAARRAVGDSAANARVIETVHGRGYRFVAPVHVRDPGEPLKVSPTPGAKASPFVGRENAMERFRLGLAATVAGRAGLLLVAGEPGIGKTRITLECAAEARGGDAAVLFGRCQEGEGAPAFWPWVQILRAAVAGTDSEALLADLGPGASDIAELLPELGDRLDLQPAGRIGDDEQARFRLFDSVTGFLKRAAARRPLVIFLDDLHQADEASLRLLEFAAGRTSDSRLLIVGTYRDVEVRRGKPLAAVLGSLARVPNCERISLRGLTAEETERLVRETFGAEPIDGLAARVHDMTEGNPFFIQEIVRLLMSEGRTESPYASGPLTLPQSVRDAIGRRLDGLSAECNHALRVASVLGREFDASVLEGVVEIPLAELMARLEEAREAGILVESEERPGGYTFPHTLIRQTLYDELDTPERLQRHALAGQAIERACGALPEPRLAELAHHFFQAATVGDPTRAVDYAVRAAERELHLLAYEEAAQHYKRALRAHQLRVPPDELKRCELLLGLGSAHLASDQRDEGRAAFANAAEIARVLPRPDLLARAALGYRGHQMGTTPGTLSLTLLEEALNRLSPDDLALRARIVSRLAGLGPDSNSMEMRDRRSREALALARRADDPEALREALDARCWACLGPDRIDERLEVAQELLSLADSLNDPSMAALGFDVQMGYHLIRGESEAADRALTAFARTAKELRQPALISASIVWRGSRAMDRGDFAEAEKLIHEALERGLSSWNDARFVYAGQMYMLRLRRGDPEAESDPVFSREMVELPYSWAPAIRGTLALHRALDGEIPEASREFEALAARDFADHPRDEHWLMGMGVLAHLACALGDTQRAAVLYELLDPYADLMMIHDLLRESSGSTAAVLGDLATLLGRYREGAAHFEHAIAKEGAACEWPQLLMTKASYARLLHQRAGQGDALRSEVLIDEVKAGWRTFGIGPAAPKRAGLTELFADETR